MDNKIKRPCEEVAYSERVQRISDMKWAGQRHKAHTGICQFCGNILPIAYRIFTPDGKCHEATMESPAGARAQEILDSGVMPEGTHVFPLASCEVMCDADLFENGLRHYAKRSEDWKINAEIEAKKRIAASSNSTTTAGAVW